MRLRSFRAYIRSLGHTHRRMEELVTEVPSGNERMTSLYKKPTYRPERVKKAKVRSNTHYGTDWWDPPAEYLDPQTGRMAGEKSLVYSHLCFKSSQMTCPLVRDTDPIVVQGLRSKISLHDPDTLVWNREAQVCECRSCKSPKAAARKPRPSTRSRPA